MNALEIRGEIRAFQVSQREGLRYLEPTDQWYSF